MFMFYGESVENHSGRMGYLATDHHNIKTLLQHRNHSLHPAQSACLFSVLGQCLTGIPKTWICISMTGYSHKGVDFINI